MRCVLVVLVACSTPTRTLPLAVARREIARVRPPTFTFLLDIEGAGSCLRCSHFEEGRCPSHSAAVNLRWIARSCEGDAITFRLPTDRSGWPAGMQVIHAPRRTLSVDVATRRLSELERVPTEADGALVEYVSEWRPNAVGRTLLAAGANIPEIVARPARSSDFFRWDDESRRWRLVRPNRIWSHF